MKILKRFLSLVCAFALLISAAQAARAQSVPMLYFTDCTVTAGGSAAYCFLKMDMADNIAAMDYIITYDSQNLELTNIYKSGLADQSDVTVSINSDEPGIIRVTLVSQNGISGSGFLNLMYFKAKAAAVPGTYPISVLVNEAWNTSLETVSVSKKNGVITLKEKSQTVKNVRFTSTVSVSSLKVGEEVDYRLGASGLNGLAAGAFEFYYDDTRLKLNDVVLSDSVKSAVNDVNADVKGLVRVAFAAESAINSCANLVTLKFSAVDTGTAGISFKPGDLYDCNFAGMTGNEFSKTVEISERETVIDYYDFKALVPDKIYSDKEFTVRIALQGGSGVRAGDFSVTYDSGVLECIGVDKETINGVWVVTDKNCSDGKIRFSLMSNVDLAEDTTLVSIRFKATENNDSETALQLAGTGVCDADFKSVTLDYIGAEINIVRPVYTVNFYDADGTSLISTQEVKSGNSAIPPKPTEIKQNDSAGHLKFSGWDKEYARITDNTDLIAVYTDEAHTVVTRSGVKPSCTEPGLTEGRYCVVCDAVLAEQTVIPANGHTEAAIPDIEPGCDMPGYIGGGCCSVCGVVLIEPKLVPPTGPRVNAVLNSDGSLTVSGALSDSASLEGTTLIAVYDGAGRLLNNADITALNQSDFQTQISHCAAAQRIKIMRWDMKALKPLSGATEVDVKPYETVYAELDSDGVLHVCGSLTNISAKNETAFIAVYSSDKRLICVKNISEIDKSDIDISIEGMREAYSVKALRWKMPELMPLDDAAEVTVNRNARNG